MFSMNIRYRRQNNLIRMRQNLGVYVQKPEPEPVYEPLNI